MQRGGSLCVAAICAALAALFAAEGAAEAATYAVGPSRQYRDLQAVARLLKPGDRVEVDGGATYPGGVIFREDGAKAAKITIVGVRAGGARPVIEGDATTVELRGSHYVFEGFEIRGGTSRCLFHHADDILVRDTVIHDCPAHGVLSADSDSGSLTLSYVEVYRAGMGEMRHPIYVATDEDAFPRSVFRMEHCYVHDGLGGNNVKSRAERNEIYSNWIEGAFYHAVELIGPDGDERKRAREDSDVVGNVIRKATQGFAIRAGGDGTGDGTGETRGRYRFVNNTILLGPKATGVFRLFNGIESLEAHNNVIAREHGGALRVLVEDEVRWTTGHRVIAGMCNWVPMGSSGVPGEWKRTIFGTDPGLASPQDPRPVAGSPLIGAGAPSPEGPPRFAFPAPLAAPRELPPPGGLERVGTAVSRLRGGIDIGAFPFHPPPAEPSAPPRPRARGGCACQSGEAVGGIPAPALAWILVFARIRRRRRR
jgi:MYXO-CTERM domain-containing protein